MQTYVPNISLAAEVCVCCMLKNEATMRNSQATAAIGRPRDVMHWSLKLTRILKHVQSLGRHWLVLDSVFCWVKVRLVNVQSAVLQNAVLHHLNIFILKIVLKFLIEIPSVHARVGELCGCTFHLSRSFFETGASALGLLGSCLLASRPPRGSCRARHILVELY